MAGPGFAKDDFVRWATEEAARRGGEEGKKLARSLPKWLAVHASSAHKHALREALADPNQSIHSSISLVGAQARPRGRRPVHCMLDCLID